LTSAADLTLRPAGQDDAELLYRIYASTREAELAVVPWDASAKEAFLRMQFAAQDSHYRQAFPAASYDLILCGAQVLGRLYVDRGAAAWLVLDIALLPEHRGRGLGTGLMTAILAGAAAAGLPVRLHVEQHNPARRLYERLGFRALGGDGVYAEMEWRPASCAPAS
jgi:ribosomal protein S18 acetylase RimI-like enzyme